jgi:preprotein translocase subunit SecE
MAMNREQRRYLQRQGQIDDDGNPMPLTRERQVAPAERSSPREYFSEVRTELGRVIWPTRQETINYTIVVIVCMVVVTGLVALLDFVFAEGLFALLDAGQ